MRITQLNLKEVGTGNGKRAWQVTWPAAGIGRHRRRFKDEDAAKKFKKEKRAELEEFTKAATLTLHERCQFLECRELLKPFAGKTLRDAVKHYVEHLAGTSRSCTARKLVSELLKAKEADGVSEKHLRDIRCRLSVFAKHFDGQLVSTISGEQIDEWLRSIPLAPFTRNRYGDLAVMAFKFAMRRGYAATNPASDAARAQCVAKKVGILTVEQATALLKSCCDEVRASVAIGLFAGLRAAEIKRLDWSDVDLEDGQITVTAENKTGRRAATIQPNLREWLMPLKRESGPVEPQSCFRQMFEAARKTAGISIWPHNALRHSCASYRLAHSKNEAATAMELGNSVAVLNKRYKAIVKRADAEQFWQIVPKEPGNEISEQRDSHHRQNVQ